MEKSKSPEIIEYEIEDFYDMVKEYVPLAC